MEIVFYYILGVLWAASPILAFIFYNKWQNETARRKNLQYEIRSLTEVIKDHIKQNKDEKSR